MIFVKSLICLNFSSCFRLAKLATARYFIAKGSESKVLCEPLGRGLRHYCLLLFLSQVVKATCAPGLLEKLQESNVLLEHINRGLNSYLEKKRLYFPRYLH